MSLILLILDANVIKFQNHALKSAKQNIALSFFYAAFKKVKRLHYNRDPVKNC